MDQGRTREEMLAKLEQRRRGEISPAELVKWHGEPRDAAVKEARETFMTEMVALLELFHRGEITGEELYGPFKELQLGGPTQSDELFEITGDVESASGTLPEHRGAIRDDARRPQKGSRAKPDQAERYAQTRRLLTTNGPGGVGHRR